MTAEQINKILGISESFKMPETLMQIVLDDDRRDMVMDEFMQIGESLDHDWFTEYFEEQHSNKTKMAQDFTPRGVSDLLSYIIGKPKTIADVCAGTGGLTIAQWDKNNESKFYCYELSERAIPLLLFNLSIRNMRATVIRMNILTDERYEAYEVKPSDVYSHVTQCECPFIFDTVDAVVSNPPYSQKYDPKADDRFPQFKDMLPTNFADFVFVAFSLSILNDGGKMGFVLPHGILFRGAKEKAFRQKLIESGLVKSVIGLPDKLFLNTGIPVLILEIDTSGASTDVLFVDASQECLKDGKLNILDEEHLNTIIGAIKLRRDIERFAKVATLEEIKENDFNLNISRYVDTYVPEPYPDFGELMNDLATIQREIYETQKELFRQTAQLVGTTQEAERTFANGIKEYVDILNNGEASYRKEVTQIESDRHHKI